jgi:hypothetical protein
MSQANWPADWAIKADSESTGWSTSTIVSLFLAKSLELDRPQEAGTNAVSI